MTTAKPSLLEIPSTPYEHKRLLPLEATRGYAAIVVVITHFLLAFSPITSGLLPQARTAESQVGHWYYFLLNGTGAVIFFFTLSGFVLCWPYFKSENKQQLVKAFLKRWPRLAGPVLVTTLLSYLLFKFDLYFFEPASLIIPGPWLADFGCPTPYCESGWVHQFQPSLFDAITKGLTTFFTGNTNYNTNLWTMQIEFVGSIVVFCLAAFLALILSFNFLLASFIIFATWSLSFFPYLFPFICGIHLAACCIKYQPKVRKLNAIILIIIGLYLLSYLISEKDYHWLSYIYFPSLIQKNLHIIINSFGSILIIFSIMANRSIYDLMDGRLSAYLGKLSFPLYLVHTIIICSLSSYVFIFFNQVGQTHAWILTQTFLITLTASVAVSSLVIYFDEWWLKKINYIVENLTSPK